MNDMTYKLKEPRIFAKCDLTITFQLSLFTLLKLISRRWDQGLANFNRKMPQDLLQTQAQWTGNQVQIIPRQEWAR